MSPSLASPAEVTVDTRRKPPGLVRRAWRQRKTKIGLVLAAPVVLVAVFGHYVAGETTSFVAAPFEVRSAHGPFGSDVLGRDVWARFLDGGRSTLFTAVMATLLGVGAGSVIGLVTALSSSRTSYVVGRLLDLALVFPLYVLALVVVSVFGPSSVTFVIAFAFTPVVGRVIRAAALEVTQREHVHYARLLGSSRWELLRREILPNVTGPLSVEAGLRLTFAIALVAALSYLGFGAQPPQADWGTMISENQVGLQIQPWGVFLPVLAIAVLTVGTNLIAEGFASASAKRSGYHEIPAEAIELIATQPGSPTEVGSSIPSVEERP